MEVSNLEILKIKLALCYKIYEEYAWLLNCYVLDFFTEKHWNKLTNNWQYSLEDLAPNQIAQLLNYDAQMNSTIWPLSILALKKLLIFTSLPRKMSNVHVESPYFTKDNKLLKLFWKNVKAKKRHEISIMTKICYQTAKDTNCFYIVDIGAGLGHLSRMLNYGYGFKVCTIEAQESLSLQARKLDYEFEQKLKRKIQGHLSYHQTIHLNMKIHANITPSNFLTIMKKAFSINHNDFKFGIVGLHPCGDLGATLLKLYNNCNNVQYIIMAGCCYMKLTTQPDFPRGFPLSRFCQEKNYNLSYHSREIACHAIENYVGKLLQGEWWRLKIHTYRAALETIIIQIDPQNKHCALNNVKYTEDLPFEKYCEKAVRKLGIAIPENSIKSEQTHKMLNQWKKVVLFYSLRLLFAPVIETIILLDRLLFVEESNGSEGILRSVFDSATSPRSHVLTAKKSYRTN